jgi:hypothetical protein
MAAAFIRWCKELRADGILAENDPLENWAVNRLDAGVRGVLLKAGVPDRRLDDATYQIPVTIAKVWGHMDPLEALVNALRGADIKFAPQKIADDVLDEIKKIRRWEREQPSGDSESIDIRIRDENWDEPTRRIGDRLAPPVRACPEAPCHRSGPGAGRSATCFTATRPDLKARALSVFRA